MRVLIVTVFVMSALNMRVLFISALVTSALNMRVLFISALVTSALIVGVLTMYCEERVVIIEFIGLFPTFIFPYQYSFSVFHYS